MIIEDIFIAILIFLLPVIVLAGIDSKKIDFRLGTLLYFIMLILEVLVAIQLGIIVFHASYVSSTIPIIVK